MKVTVWGLKNRIIHLSLRTSVPFKCDADAADVPSEPIREEEGGREGADEAGRLNLSTSFHFSSRRIAINVSTLAILMLSDQLFGSAAACREDLKSAFTKLTSV